MKQTLVNAEGNLANVAPEQAQWFLDNGYEPAPEAPAEDEAVAEAPKRRGRPPKSKE